ncbi:MAG: hypothetical protein ACOX6G_03250 [Christensenellales bacterium]|jgi:hypothetical protein
MFAKEERELLNKIGFSEFEIDNADDDIYVDMEIRVGDHLVFKSLDENYMPNKEGRICEAILDKLADL